MKICPKCGKTYTDESLNFCLDDGTVLNRTETGTALPETVLMSQPRSTGAPNPFQAPNSSQNRSLPTQINSSPKKASKTWLWVVGIFGVVILVCGGGLTGLFMLGKMSDNKNDRNVDFGNTNAYNTVNKTNGNIIKTNVNIAKTETSSEVEKIDLSAWVRDNSQYGKTEFRGNELIVNAKQNNFYYVLVAPATYKSASNTTKIALRDVESSNSLGAGLIINSNPVPLIKDYAFLINAKTGKYRIVTHTPGNEKTVVNWKTSSAIKTGNQENVLEVQDENGQFKFFINGVLMETLSTKESYQDGVPGIYVGGASPVAFTNLEIRK